MICYAMLCYAMLWYGYDMTWKGMTWCDMTWHDMKCHVIAGCVSCQKMKLKRDWSYPPPKVNGAAPAPAPAPAAVAVGATEGVAGIENPNPVLAGTDAVVPAILAVI